MRKLGLLLRHFYTFLMCTAVGWRCAFAGILLMKPQSRSLFTTERPSYSLYGIVTFEGPPRSGIGETDDLECCTDDHVTYSVGILQLGSVQLKLQEK